MRLKIYELYSARLFPVPVLAWQTALKKTKVKLDLLTDIDKLLMVKKCITEGICHAIHPYVKANNNYERLW